MAAEPSSGFVIMRGEQVVTSIAELHDGDVIRIISPDGVAIAEIKSVDKNNN